MRLNKLTVLGTAFLASLTVSTAGSLIPSPAEAEGLPSPIVDIVVNANRKPAAPAAIAQAQTAVVLNGNFVKAEAPTTGTAKIVQENGHRYLEIDSAFSTSNQGPDLHVLLDSAAKPPQSYTDLNRTINLGKLQSYQGAQRYPIPDSVNVNNFKTVVIWCRMANATFGYANLNPAMNASR